MAHDNQLPPVGVAQTKTLPPASEEPAKLAQKPSTPPPAEVDRMAGATPTLPQVAPDPGAMNALNAKLANYAATRRPIVAMSPEISAAIDKSLFEGSLDDYLRASRDTGMGYCRGVDEYVNCCGGVADAAADTQKEIERYKRLLTDPGPIADRERKLECSMYGLMSLAQYLSMEKPYNPAHRPLVDALLPVLEKNMSEARRGSKWNEPGGRFWSINNNLADWAAKSGDSGLKLRVLAASCYARELHKDEVAKLVMASFPDVPRTEEHTQHPGKVTAFMDSLNQVAQDAAYRLGRGGLYQSPTPDKVVPMHLKNETVKSPDGTRSINWGHTLDEVFNTSDKPDKRAKKADAAADNIAKYLNIAGPA